MGVKITLILFLFTCLIVSAQQMQKGFTYLETGKYNEAITFFETILKDYPTNKTAQLCYGRAVGLAGNSNKAVSIFMKLKTAYPSDFEIKLNYAESLLWNKQYSKAQLVYEKLIMEDASSFSAMLGYANTLSNLKNYEKALEYVNKALQIQKGNANAMLSRKFIRLGYAHKLSQNKFYEKALTLLDKNLIDFSNDKDTQLNKASIYLITNKTTAAEKVYTEIAINAKDSIVALNGLSLIAHKKHKEKKALALASLAKNKVEHYKEDEDLYLLTNERYIQALLWNRKFKKSKNEIEKMEVQYPNHSRIWGLKATNGMHTSNFKISLENYRAILEKDSSSFDGNLGIANAYRAIGKERESYSYAFKTLRFFSQQPDAEKLIKTLKSAHTPSITQKTAFTADNGNNEAIHASLFTVIPLSMKAETRVEYAYRNTKNTRTKNEASTNELAMHFLYKFNGNVSLKTKGGISKSNAFTTNYTQWTGEVQLKTKPYKLQNLDIGYQRGLQNFNADLIDREIVMNNYSVNYNLGTNVNLGWYTQYMYTSQTDNNTRNLLFTSLYYTILNRPSVKLGANYQYITFKNQVPTIYFSPNKFNVVELFVDIVSKESGKWFYAANTAAGYQYIEKDPKSTTFRAEAKLGYQLSNRFSSALYGKYSNIASATASGFKFTEFGLLLKWYFLKQPIFNQKIIELQEK